MITFSLLFRDRAGMPKIRARSMRKAIESAKAMGADRVFQGGYGWDSGWLTFSDATVDASTAHPTKGMKSGVASLVRSQPAEQEP